MQPFLAVMAYQAVPLLRTEPELGDGSVPPNEPGPGPARIIQGETGPQALRDSEWIGLGKASEDHANMLLEVQGSVDVPEIGNRGADILESGQEAYMQRGEKTGFEY